MDTTRQTNSKSSLFSPLRLALTGLMTAVLCILGPLVHSASGQSCPHFLHQSGRLDLRLCAGHEIRHGQLSFVSAAWLYRLPVFSGFSGGPAKLAGPTGGYLIGFLFLALIAGVFLDRFPKKLSSSCGRNDPRHGRLLPVRHALALPSDAADLWGGPDGRCHPLSARRRGEDRRRHSGRSRSEKSGPPRRACFLICRQAEMFPARDRSPTPLHARLPKNLGAGYFIIKIRLFLCQSIYTIN